MSAGFGSRMSLGVRLSLLFAACTAAVSLIAGLIFSRAIDEHFVELDHMAMSAKLAVFRDELRGLGSEQQMRRREAELLRELARHPDLGLRLNGPDGNLWFERLPQPAHPGLPANRELGAPLEPGNDASPRLTVILDISHHQHFLQRMRQLIWLTMSLSALATALLGAWATGASLAPLRRMREVAARVSANSLTTRLDASRMPEELRGLAGELNAMLARLEEAFQRLSAFSADIAHELRTPLTSLLTQTQVVLSRPRSLEDYREALHGNLEELERLTAMALHRRWRRDTYPSRRPTPERGEPGSGDSSRALAAPVRPVLSCRSGAPRRPGRTRRARPGDLPLHRPGPRRRDPLRVCRRLDPFRHRFRSPAPMKREAPMTGASVSCLRAFHWRMPRPLTSSLTQPR